MNFLTLPQLKTIILGVLKGWFTNKEYLDKFGEDDSGNPTYDGNAIQASGGGSSDTEDWGDFTDAELTEVMTIFTNS